MTGSYPGCLSTRVPARTLANPIARRAYSSTRLVPLSPYKRLLKGTRQTGIAAVIHYLLGARAPLAVQENSSGARERPAWPLPVSYIMRVRASRVCAVSSPFRLFCPPGEDGRAAEERAPRAIQKGTRVLISLWDSLMFGRVPTFDARVAHLRCAGLPSRTE